MGFILGIIGLIFVFVFILFIPVFFTLIYALPFALYLDKQSWNNLWTYENSNFSNEFILLFIIYKDILVIFLLATKCYICWLTFRCPKNPTKLFNFKNPINTLDELNNKLNNSNNLNTKIEHFFDNQIIKLNNFSNKLDNLASKIDESTKRQLERNKRDKARLKALFRKHKEES